MKKFLTFFLFVITALSFAQTQERVSPVKENALSNVFALGIDGGITLPRTDYLNIRPDIMGRLSLEYMFPSHTGSLFGLKILGSGGYMSGHDYNKSPKDFRTTFFNFGGGITYTFSIQDAVYPYLFGGVSYLHFDPKNGSGQRLKNNAAGIYSRNEINYLGEIGLHFLFSGNASFNAGAGAELSPKDNWDDIVRGGDNDFMFYVTVGFSYAFKLHRDSDDDGIPNDIDQCPNTPKGVQVDEFGCPVDKDHDGVPDYIDKCPNTPQGVQVDANGCAVDNDKDGVPDYLDKCLNTPAGVQVDSTGCPLDSDHDGVPDYLDKCPNTPAGVEVDDNGCRKVKVKAPEISKVILNGNTNFESGKAVLLPGAYNFLDPLVEAMKKDITLKLKVAGYTDSVGSYEYNMELSKRRAEAVVNYFISQGIANNRFNIVARGENDPVATNSTREGRAMNRRVEITAISQ